MAPRISLALAIHNHQPVGNFGWVFADVHDRAYRPMVEALERHPTVRLALHYTGPLLEWLQAERPEFLGRLRALVERGQVELLGGGLYEPVLASLPERDRIGQLRRMADAVEAIGGRRPRGAWLAERVWEPDLPASLVAGGYDWTILDDAHFRAAAIPEEDLWGPYTTEDQGRLIRVFGTERGLRYRIPFREVDEVIDYLRDHATEAGDRVGMMGDDGEKFGAWPTTWEHCWGAGRWVDRFFEALEANADWLTTVTPSDWLTGHAPVGRVYVPTGSYAEMGEWALPPEESLAFGRVFHEAVEQDRPEARWLRGAFWRNFQVRYREINDLHKQMLRVSGKVDAMPAGPDRDRALDHLYRGQSNDCYWHGLFGGVYISHMRLATFEHLIAAEDLADSAAAATTAAELADLDRDGRDEALLATPGQVVAVKLDEGAGIGAWDVRAVRHAVVAVLRRRPEAYHEKLRAHEARSAEAARGDAPDGAGAARQRDPDEPAGTAASGEQPNAGPGDEAGAPASIHELVQTKEPNLSARIVLDDHERRSGLVRFLAPDTTPEGFAAAAATELGDFVTGAFAPATLQPGELVAIRDGEVRTPGGPAAVRVTKRLLLGGGRLDPSLGLELGVENRSERVVEARLGLEWATTMLGGGGNPAAWWRVRDERVPHDSEGVAEGLESIAQGNDSIGIAIETTIAPAADAWWAPIDTVSNSESGFERVYQGSSLLVGWPLRLEPGEARLFIVRHAVTASRDRDAEERGPDDAATGTDPGPAMPPVPA